MTKVVIIGAGSQFGGKLSRDILAFLALQDGAVVALHGTVAEGLQRVYERLKRAAGGCWSRVDKAPGLRYTTAF